MWNLWGRRELQTGDLIEKPEEKKNLEDEVVDGKIILK
jgi:hypothetical protein